MFLPPIAQSTRSLHLGGRRRCAVGGEIIGVLSRKASKARPMCRGPRAQGSHGGTRWTFPPWCYRVTVPLDDAVAPSFRCDAADCPLSAQYDTVKVLVAMRIFS